MYDFNCCRFYEVTGVENILVPFVLTEAVLEDRQFDVKYS